MINFKCKFKLFFSYFIGISLSIVITLFFLEFCLSFFPVNEGLRAQAVNSKNPIFKFEPNRKAVFSKNWNFDIYNKVSVNNAGFVNNNDYDETLNTRLLSIVGDSYVEALMVPFNKSLSGILSKKTEGNRVYSFAASGAGLSQHLVWGKHAKEKYDSNFFIFVIIANDFSESLEKYEISPGFHRFILKNNKNWELSLSNYEPSLLRRMMRHSKLAMYLITNLKIHAKLNIPLILGKHDKRKKFVSNFNADVSKEFWKDASSAADIYLDNIEDFIGTDKSRILFVIDGIRPELYEKNISKEVINSFWFKMRNYFIQEAKLRKFEIIDMQEAFKNDYNQNSKKFEFKKDSHWNSYGHATVAKSILKSNVWNKFIE